MKLLIIFLLSFNCLAQVRVDVTNNKNNRTFSAKFKTEERANKWIEKQKKNDSWGKKERLVDVERVKDKSECIEIVTQDLPLGETIERCRLPVEYTVTITDISAEVAAREKAKDDRRKERRRIKALLKEIDKPKCDLECLKDMLKFLVKQLPDD